MGTRGLKISRIFSVCRFGRYQHYFPSQYLGNFAYGDVK